MVFCLRRLGEATEIAVAPTPVLLARRDWVTPPEDGLRRRPPPPPPPASGAVALLCSGRMDGVRDGVNTLWRKWAEMLRKIVPRLRDPTC